jgi:hypothetical protein
LATVLDALVIPEGALVDLDDLDTAIESRAWGATSWRAFQALDAYARSNDRLGFWHWCETTSSPHSWPATPKKLAMNESEVSSTTHASGRPVACRLTQPSTLPG